MDDRLRNKEPGNTKETKNSGKMVGLRFLQGALIGLGAVLPGISGGVLCVVFGVYRTIMELLSHPITTLKKQYRMLIPLVVGLCFDLSLSQKSWDFAGKIPKPFGMPVYRADRRDDPFALPGGRGEGEKQGFLHFPRHLLLGHPGAVAGDQPDSCHHYSNFGWYLFCGFCIALSMIAPGMSFSTLLMPLGLYTPLVTGIGDFDFGILVPAGIGAILTVILLAKAVDSLMKNHYNLAFHGIIGIVVAATLVIIPFPSFVESVTSGVVNVVCLAVGVVAALLLDKFNRKVEVPE